MMATFCAALALASTAAKCSGILAMGIKAVYYIEVLRKIRCLLWQIIG